MEPERGRRVRLSLTNYLLAILLLCLLTVVVTVRKVNNTGHTTVTGLENVLQNSLTTKKGGKQADAIQTGRRHARREHNAIEGAQTDESVSPLAGLNCDALGGPSEEIAKEMVYWEDIPSDSLFISPFKKQGVTQYLTFEPDMSGWNNVRMAMETVVALAVAMGRTLVLPPEQSLIYVPNATRGENDKMSFSHFFPFDYVGKEHVGVEFITMQEFLEREAMTGNLHNKKSGKTSFPPQNITNWNGRRNLYDLDDWVRSVTHVTVWGPDTCLAVFPASSNQSEIQALKDIKSTIEKTGGFPSKKTYIGKPIPVNATVMERMKEIWADRKNLCIYDEKLQNARVVHFPYDDNIPGARLLAHFYGFLFFQDWRHDLWMKRFIRDHLRYHDKIQCAAARLVDLIRSRARARGDPDGSFDSFHIRRGDFVTYFRETLTSADQIYEIAKHQLTENATVYIATNEWNRTYFDPLRKHYDIVFLSDFSQALLGLHVNFHGIVEQLVASRGRVFFGCYLSTFTNYVNRLRGYHANRMKSPGFEDGIIASWYYAPKEYFDQMRKYHPVHIDFFEREFPTGWRLIDTGVESLKE